MIKVTQEIDVYEINGKEVGVGKNTTIFVNSHWNRSELIVLSVGGKTYAVSANALSMAIENAQNIE